MAPTRAALETLGQTRLLLLALGTAAVSVVPCTRASASSTSASCSGSRARGRRALPPHDVAAGSATPMPGTTCECAASKSANECWLKADKSIVGSNYCILGDGRTAGSTWTWANCVYQEKALLLNCPTSLCPVATTTTSTSTSDIDASVYVRSSPGGVCPAGATAITGKSECEQALTALGIAFAGGAVQDGEVCFQKSSSNDGGDSRICATVHTMGRAGGGCPVGNTRAIVDKSECEEALAALGMSFKRAGIQDGKACFQTGKGLGRGDGTQGPVARLVCRTTADRRDTAHDVVVVGAGSAGLYAAKNLRARGYSVLVLEATGAVGGRVKSATLGDMRVEMGAEEHYGADGSNPVHPALQAKYGASVYAPTYQGLYANSMDEGKGTCWNSYSAKRRCTPDSDITRMDNYFYDWYWPPYLHTDPTSTLADDVMDEFGVGPSHRAYHLYDTGFAGGSYTTNLDQIGARSMALQSNQWDLSSSTVGITDKNLGYLDALKTVWWDDVVKTSDVLLHSPVTRIDTRKAGEVVVTDAGGSQHAARQVIITVPIGVLQAEAIEFVPALPSVTVAAFNGIGNDKGMKVPLRFSSAWWETEGESLAWLVAEGVAGACWTPSDYKVGTSSHILMCYPMGGNARSLNDIAEAADGGAGGDAAIIRAILLDLDRTFPRAIGQASKTYLDGIVQNWGDAPYTKGVYSFPKVGTYTTASNSKRQDLQAPVANSRIFFAGEASHVTHPATVPGALHEGERAANAVHTANGKPNSPPDAPAKAPKAP